MPPPPEGPTPSDRWLAERFAAYYARHAPALPDRFGRREYGYLFFGQKSMLRHVGFRTRAEFEDFHARRAPAHSYYSTAYYDRPDAPTMKEKGWKAAELIFDLDADHVPGAEKMAYPDQLKEVKRHFLRLVDEFILRDFGFEEKDLLLTFSGGRGYHCHVLSERALELTSQERREIVDYITGTGLDLGTFVRPHTPLAGDPAAKRRSRKSVKVGSEAAGGWSRRLNEGLRQYVVQLKAKPISERIAQLKAIPGVGEAGLREATLQIERMTEDQLRDGLIDRGAAVRKLISVVVEQQIIPLAKGETDEPVTSDTKRLIRTPGSLHGKSGLRVVTLTRDQIDAFDPLMDAVAFSDEPVAVNVVKPFEVKLKGKSVKLAPGRERVPEWAAVFAMMRGAAVPADPA